MSSWASSWRTSLRIARREVVKHKARNTLIVAMLALPVFGAVTLDTIAHSSTRSVQEQLTREMGQASALVADGGGAIYQTPDGTGSIGVPDAPTAQSTGPNPAAAVRAIETALPGATVLPYVNDFGTDIHTPDGFLFVDTVQFDLTNPATAGMLDLRSGRWPLTTDEIVLSTTAQQQLGTKVGTSVTVPGHSGHFLVVGIADDPNALDSPTVYGLPNSIAVNPSNATTRWLVVNPTGVSWNTVRQLNAAGLLVTSRAVIADPPPRSEVPYYAELAKQQVSAPSSQAQDTATAAAIVVVVIGLVLLEVVLLAGPAFAVSARRRQREYAMLGAAGADSRDLRRMVLADGLVLGALAGVAGAAVGIGAAAATMPFISSYTHVVSGAFQVKPLEVLGAAVLAMLLGLAAALVPARSVARQDILLSLTGRRAPRQPQWKLPVGGLVLIALGAFGVYAGPQEKNLNLAALVLVVGVALLEVGAIMCTPILVGALARLGRVLPLGPRLALRDGARHRGRTTPAVAAMFAAVAGAVAAGTWFVSVDAQHRAQYKSTLLSNQVAVPVAGDKAAADLVTRLKAVLPVTGTFTTRNVASPTPGDKPRSFTVVAPMTQCSATQFGLQRGTADGGELCATSPFGSGAIEGPVIGDGGLLTRITGISDPAASSMLGRGGAVVFDPRMMHGGEVTFQIQKVAVDADSSYSYSIGPVQNIVGGSDAGADQPGSNSLTTVNIPAVYVNLHGAPDPGFVLSTAAATRLGADGGSEMLVLDLSQHISSVQTQHANKALADAGLEDTVIVENGYHSTLGILNLVILAIAVLIAAGAAGIATGLSITDGQPDLETLSAVGGSPATRRVLAGSTALIITGLGALVGVPVGFAVVGGLLKLKTLGAIGGVVGMPGRSYGLPFVVPWLNIAVAVVGVPLLTALGAMVLTRSEVRTNRRMT